MRHIHKLLGVRRFGSGEGGQGGWLLLLFFLFFFRIFLFVYLCFGASCIVGCRGKGLVWLHRVSFALGTCRSDERFGFRCGQGQGWSLWRLGEPESSGRR